MVKKKNEKTKVQIFEIEYSTNEMDFKVKIAAWSREDALGYLGSVLKKQPYKIKSFSALSTIDAISTQVIDDIVKMSNAGKDINKKEAIKPKEDKTEKPKMSMKK